MASSCSKHAAFTTADTSWPCAVHLQPTLQIPWIGRTVGIWPCCHLEKANKTTELAQSKEGNHTHKKLTMSVTEASCWEHCVSGEGVIFHSGLHSSEPASWQSVSRLIGLILGALLQEFTIRITLSYISQTLSCYLPHTLKPSLNCMSQWSTHACLCFSESN